MEKFISEHALGLFFTLFGILAFLVALMDKSGTTKKFNTPSLEKTQTSDNQTRAFDLIG